MQVTVIERSQQIQVMEQEITRRERELDAQVRKPAEAEKFRLEKLAEANRWVEWLSAYQSLIIMWYITILKKNTQNFYTQIRIIIISLSQADWNLSIQIDLQEIMDYKQIYHESLKSNPKSIILKMSTIRCFERWV